MIAARLLDVPIIRFLFNSTTRYFHIGQGGIAHAVGSYFALGNLRWGPESACM